MPELTLTQCIAQIATLDPFYAFCVANAGFLEEITDPKDLAGKSLFGSTFPSQNQTISEAQVAQFMTPTNRVCRLLCSGKSSTETCCDAAYRVLECKAFNIHSAGCKDQFDELLYRTRKCGLGTTTTIHMPQILLLISFGLCLLVFLYFTRSKWTRIVMRWVALFVPGSARKLNRQQSLDRQQQAIEFWTGEHGFLESFGDNDQHHHGAAKKATTKWYLKWLKWRLVRRISHATTQVMNLVWKDLLLRRRKPSSLVLQQLLPLLLIAPLVLMANQNKSHFKSPIPEIAVVPSNPLICRHLIKPDLEQLGAPNSTMRTFFSSGQTVIALFLVLSLLHSLTSCLSAIMIEKEIKIREVMRIMGMSSGKMLMARFVTCVLLTTLQTFFISIELKYGRVFPNAEFGSLVALFFAFQLATVAFCFFIAPFFSKARSACVLAVVLWILFFFPFYFVQKSPISVQYIAALLPPTAFGLGLDYLLRNAQLGTGLTYASAMLKAPIVPGVTLDQIPLGNTTTLSMSRMLLADALLLFLLGWYLEQVLPQEYGVQKRWNFLFTRDYWRLKIHGKLPREQPEDLDEAARAKADALTVSPTGSPTTPSSCVHSTPRHGEFIAMKDAEESCGIPVASDCAAVEPVDAMLASQEKAGTCLQIAGLRKTFKTEDGEKTVVHGLNLTLYSGQITALLGHNGAGKTTTISMLTGLIPATSGNASMYGHTLQGSLDDMRQLMGICPQHDVLFDDLTVQEHLEFFAIMKCVPSAKVERQVNHYIDEVGLTEKRHTLAKHLSGGQKRKLSVAIAFIGDSRLVFLDEPTSGMDPFSRRFTWNLLQRKRANRVIVLTTHFMDEADLLGDRIAIMSDGMLRCAGSSFFLKHRYGAGYNLTLLKQDEGFELNVTQGFIEQYVPEVSCLSHFGAEVVFQLPASASAVFPSMLSALDAQLELLRIARYGVSVTTLEEVFLRIARDRNERNALVNVSGRSSVTSTEVEVLHKTDALGSKMAISLPGFRTQLSALLRKRIRIARRDGKSRLYAIGIPFVFFVLLVLLPEIQVADFYPQHSPSIPRKDSTCPVMDKLQPNTPQSHDLLHFLYNRGRTICEDGDFDYCATGVVPCNRDLCCSPRNRVSPFYYCSTCAMKEGGTFHRNACFNRFCVQKKAAKLQATLNAFLITIIVVLAYSFVPAALVGFVVKEKDPIQNSKYLQLISGASPGAYWIANALYDFILCWIPLLLGVCTIPIAAASSHVITSMGDIGGVASVLLVYLLVVIPLSYVVSFRYEQHAIAQTSLLSFCLGTGGMLSIFSFICRVIDFEITPTFTLADLDRDYLRWIFLVFPGYALNNGLFEILLRKVSREPIYGRQSAVVFTPGQQVRSSFFGYWPGFGKDKCVDCWNAARPDCCVREILDFDVALAPILYGLVECVLLIVLVWYLERRQVLWKQKQKPVGQKQMVEDDTKVPTLESKGQSVDQRVEEDLAEMASPSDSTCFQMENDEDDDVVRERTLVMQPSAISSKSNNLVIRDLHKRYPKAKKPSLVELSMALPRGECFGFLGVNGAGKSTTMKILTGQILPTSGSVYLGGYDLAKDLRQARTCMGYCPQFDALHDLLTVREQLELYAELRGLPNHLQQAVIDKQIREMGLGLYETKLTRGLSGGNKRKVSTAIALMGNPRVVFLDEPSTGVDPSARRQMWDVIARACSVHKASIMLTTHSMEECEALCGRVGILLQGKLCCLGNISHLKTKFGQGYTVEVRLEEPDAHVLKTRQEQVTNVLLGSGGDGDGDGEDQVRIHHRNVIGLCSALGNASRSDIIRHGHHGGWSVLSWLETTGSIPLREFCLWWETQELSVRLRKFFKDTFPVSHLVEQQGDYFRFQVAKDQLPLWQVFEVLEKHKKKLFVKEYSVCDTSLEHIFNRMVLQQQQAEAEADGHGEDLVTASSRCSWV